MKQLLMQEAVWLNFIMNIMEAKCHKLDAQGLVAMPWSVLIKTKSPPEGR